MKPNKSFLPLCDGIFYFPSGIAPLASDIFLIVTEQFPVLFDVGNGNAALSAAVSVKNPAVVLSHFHEDHVGNVNELTFSVLYQTKITQKHTVPGTIVTEETAIANNVDLFPFPNSHAKGSLALKTDSLLFLGDALYPGTLNGKACYNTVLLKEEIDLIKKIAPQKIVASHRKKPVIPVDIAISFLERIYHMRDPAETYIFADFPVIDKE